MDLSNLRNIQDQKLKDAESTKRHNELLLDNTRTQETIVRSVQSLVKYMEKRVSRTEVVNQLKEIGTPDVDKVVTALDSLHNTLKQHKNTDLSEITGVMRGVLEEVKKVPKELPKQQEQQFVDYSKQLKELASNLSAIEKAVKAQELKVDAPIVNVPETVVNVDAPDLKPIQSSVESGSKDVVKAVKGIKLPELKTDPLEKLLKKTNKLLEELPSLMPSGGGGGGSSWVTTNTAGTPVPIGLTSSGAVPVEATDLLLEMRIMNGAMAMQVDDTSGTLYQGWAEPGTATSAAGWRIRKVVTSGTPEDTSITFADGDRNFNNVWDNRASLTYA